MENKEISSDKTSLGKKTTMISGALFTVSGIFFLIVIYAPDIVGSVGQHLNEHYLKVYLGEGSMLAGLYCLGIGLTLLFIKRKITYIIGITCLIATALIGIDAYFSEEKTILFQHKTYHGAYLGHILRSNKTNLLGLGGLILTWIFFILIGGKTKKVQDQ
jgi:hypothetical protein